MTLARRQLLRCSLKGLMLMPLSAWAKGQDDGEYLILQARYGAGDRQADVTQALRKLARKDRRVRVSNELMGVDPAPGERKVLRILARGSDGQVRTFEFAEYSQIDGHQFKGWSRGDWGREDWQDDPHRVERPDADQGRYRILQARYGTEQQHIEVTSRLRELARQDQRVRITNALFGHDPAPGQRKTLRIFVRDLDGSVRTLEYEEYSTIDGQQFIGWGRGQWGEDGWRGDWNGRESPGALRILHAIYGVHGRDVDVTDRLRRLQRRDGLEVLVDNRLAGRDPYPGERKGLTVRYRWGDGPEQELRVAERDTLRLP